ncbi:MAG: hypothetical protein AAGG01_12630, partial [Planctomycetota bacterium]
QVVVSVQDIETEWSLTIENADGDTLASLEVPAEVGVHVLSWDFRRDPRSEEAKAEGRRGGSLGTGRYTAVLMAKGDEKTEKKRRKAAQRQSFNRRQDPLLFGASPAEMAGESAPEIRD